MKPTTKKKLSLSRTTIRSLDADDLQRAAGAGRPSYGRCVTDPGTATCDPSTSAVTAC